jgi:thiosulfate dehydrogenase [quinone] large subunit
MLLEGGHGEPPKEVDIMTRQKTYLLTAISAALYVLLTWIFSDGMFSTPLWNSDVVTASPIWTYVLLATIIGLGFYQASQIPEEGVLIEPDPYTRTKGQVDDPASWKLLLGNSFYALLWLPIRFFVGRDWLAAGEHKIRDDAWMNGGTALKGYWTSATAIPEGAKASKAQGTVGWFHDFLVYMLNHEWYTWFAKVIAVGEFLVGIGLVVGALVGIAAFFGSFMNINFMLAGTTSMNPVLFALTVLLVLGWKVAGFWGLDRVLLPILRTPWNRFGEARPHNTTPPTPAKPLTV